MRHRLAIRTLQIPLLSSPRFACTRTMANLNTNRPAPGATQYYPVNEPQIGHTFPKDVYPQNEEDVKLFKPLTIRGVTFKNRIWVSPMCQYSSDNGHATDWHLVHIGGFATRGAGAVCMEATAVVAEGRISPEDAGIWTDSQIAPLKRIVDFCHGQGTLIGVQLAHAGRKASTLAPWVHSDPAHTRVAERWEASQEENGWPDNVWAASAIPFANNYPSPKEMTEQELDRIEEAFVAAVKRCEEAGFDFIELHGAHGYLLHTFVSPLSNTRSDKWGGQSLENRLRYPLRIARAVRAAWKDKPLFWRLSAVDWAEGPEQDEKSGGWKQWGLQQSIELVKKLKEEGVDLVDCSSGGLWVKQRIAVGPGYQVPFAEAIKRALPGFPIGSVGMITSPTQAEEYIRDGKTDVVSLAREFIRDPHFVMRAAQELGVAVKPANQYERGWVEMTKPRK